MPVTLKHQWLLSTSKRFVLKLTKRNRKPQQVKMQRKLTVMCSSPTDISTTHVLHLDLKKVLEEGRILVRLLDQDICFETVSFIYGRKALPTKPQKYDCLLWQAQWQQQLTCQHWWMEYHKTLPLDEEFRVIMISERQVSFFYGQDPGRLSNSKWSALNKSTKEKHPVDTVCYIQVYTKQ